MRGSTLVKAGGIALACGLLGVSEYASQAAMSASAQPGDTSSMAGMSGASGSPVLPSLSSIPVPPDPSPSPVGSGLLPGMPPPLSATDIYAADAPGLLSPVVQGFPSRIYVPNSVSNTVTVIDPATFRVIGTYPVGPSRSTWSRRGTSRRCGSTTTSATR